MVGLNYNNKDVFQATRRFAALFSIIVAGFVCAYSTVTNHAVPEGVVSICTTMIGVSLTIYGGSKTYERKMEADKCRSRELPQ